MDERVFGALGVFAGGISFPSELNAEHPLHQFINQCSSLLAKLYTVKSDEDTKKALTKLTALTKDAGVGSMVGQSQAETLTSVRNWMRRTKLGFEHQPNKQVMNMWADLAREDIFYKKVSCMALNFDRDGDARKPEFYFGPQLDKDLNCFQLSILLLTFLKIDTASNLVEKSRIELLSENELLHFKVNNVRKVLEVMVVGKHYFMTPECMSRLSKFLGRCEKYRTKRMFDSEVIDDLWQIVNNSCCMTTVLKYMYEKNKELFDMDAFALYFGPMGMADSHIFDVPLLSFVKKEFEVYGEAEMMALGTAALAMGDKKILEQSSLFKPLHSLLNSPFEAIKEYFEEDATCIMNVMIAKYFNHMHSSWSLIYASRPQISIEFFHNRHAFLRSEGFVVFDISPEKVSLKDSFDADGLFAEYPKERFIQGKILPGGKLIVKGARVLKKIKLQGFEPVITGLLDSVEAGDMIVASYEDVEFKGDFVIEAFAPSEGIREKFLLVSAMLNSKYSKNAVCMLVQ